MYFWIVILFSMVTIMTYKMSARQDDFDRRTVPAIEASVGGIVQQHKAISAYLEDNPGYTFTKAGEVLDETLYAEYIPYGAQLAGRYSSIIMCINQTDGSMAMECGEPGSMNFLLTYAPLPVKWMGKETEFLASLGRYTSRIDEVGIVELKTEEPTSGPVRGDRIAYVINSIKGDDKYIPQMFGCVVPAVSPVGMVMYMTQLTGGGDETSYIRTASGYCDLDTSDNP